MSFDPQRHLVRISGKKEYLPVAARIMWMREERPNWSITTEPVVCNTDEKYAIFKATIMDEDGRVLATAHKMEDAKGFFDYVEKAETGAVGRALGLCGFGTAHALEFDEGMVRLADAPQEAPPVGVDPVEAFMGQIKRLWGDNDRAKETGREVYKELGFKFNDSGAPTAKGLKEAAEILKACHDEKAYRLILEAKKTMGIAEISVKEV